jgi:hypothetical protein
MGYKILGYVVWNGGKMFLRRRYGHLVPSRSVVAAGVAGVALVAAAGVFAAKRGSE